MSEFRIQITPLIRPNNTIVEADIDETTQFWDPDVDHVLNGFKTGKVKLSMHDPIVAGLEPWEFALRILYEDRHEPVFWGPANIRDDFEAGYCLIEGTDPGGGRMSHHYVRRGDVAITDIPELDKGVIHADVTGIGMVIDAAQNIASQDTRNDPSLGLSQLNYDFVNRIAPIIIERGQECWSIIKEIANSHGGPDLDPETNRTLLNYYAYISCYTDLGTDRTSATPDAPTTGQVVLNYGPQLRGVTIDPQRPTTHAHVLSSEAKFRRTAGSADASNKVGPTVDWIPTDLTFEDGDDGVLQELADAHVEAYGYAPKFITVTARPDAILNHSYGHPNANVPVGTTAPTFYLGDRVTVRAVRGYRNFSGPARIIRARLTQQGARGPALTQLTLVPTTGVTRDGEEA